ncbi:MAG TPA: SIMPL domain-containing protein [Anaerolineales bacterium]|nr:SIMPL domain-containing protein [Anaerolineales bacterium]
MRKRTFLLSGLLLIAMVLSACSGVAAAQTTQPAQAPLRTLAVTGRGEVLLAPDIANIYVGVHTEGKDAAEAVASNNAQAIKVADALKDLGVDEKDIQTTNFSIYPQQQFDERGTVTGTTYVVDNTVFVIVRDLDQLGALLDVVVNTGANSISGIQFDVADKETPMAEGRVKAVENARSQAELLAKAAGVTLGQIQSISVSSGSPTPFFAGKGAMEEAASAVPISPGQLSITAEVTIVFEIR